MAPRFCTALVLAALALAVADLERPAAQSSSANPNVADPCNIRTSERIVAVGDVHGALEPLVAILRAAGIIDLQNRWSGGRATLVQTGDLVDRGPDSARVIDFFRRLEGEAQQAGGRVIVLMGNHEFQRLQGDWRYVHPDEVSAFRTPESEQVRQRLYVIAEENARKRAIEDALPHDELVFRQAFMQQVPLGQLEMREAFAPKGGYGAWMRTRDALVRINGIVFVHGGISPGVAEMGCAAINDTVRSEAALESPSPQQRATMFASSDEGPLLYRALTREVDATLEAQFTATLAALDARAMVIGHTVAPGSRIASRFAGRLLQIDTGMLGGQAYPGGLPSALEINGDVITAIYQTSRDRLPSAW